MNDHGCSVKTDRCDLCGKRDLGLEYESYGTPVLFSCRVCGPHHFQHEAAALLLRALLPAVFATA
jgi:hypothetical protein